MKRISLFQFIVTVLMAAFCCSANGQMDQLRSLPQSYDLPPTYAEPVVPAEVIQSGPVIGDPPPIGSGWGWGMLRGWSGGFEVGLNGTEGNSVAQSLQLGFDLDRETTRTLWSTDFIYAKTESNGVQTQHNALFRTNVNWKFANPRWTWFTKLGLEYDEFKDFDIRLFMNTGLGYFFIQNDVTELKGRFGGGSSREFGGVDEDWVPEAVFGTDFEHQLTSRQKIGAVFDYYPSWKDFSDYRMITDAYWELLLDEESNMNLRVSILDRYDSTPNGAERNDVNYALLLLWKI